MWNAFVSPVRADERAAVRAVWQGLPEELRSGNQVLGRASAGCAATYGVMERCNFSCSACYLSGSANGTPPLPFEEVRDQLDQIRKYLGPKGNVQITAGEVTLLPVERLVRILRHCQKVELSPMVMTNGSVILKDPSYLERLVTEGGLEKVAIHIDTTQRGRPGLRKGDRESDIHPMREAFAGLVRDTRRRTGRTLHGAHTVTVTPDNIADVPDVVRWTLRNADAFRILSLQPAASAGRTHPGVTIRNKELLWRMICDGLGTEANPRAWSFGDPDCNTVAPMFVLSVDGEIRVVEVTRAGKPIDRWFLRRFFQGGLGGFRGSGDGASVAIANIAGRLLRHPRYLLEIPFYCLYRAWTDRRAVVWLLMGMLRLRRCSVRPFAVVVHNFMGADEVETVSGRQRMAACAFRVPIDGEMVSMCALNATDRRRRLNKNDQKRLAADTVSHPKMVDAPPKRGT